MLADYLQEEFKISVTRACSVIALAKSVYYYRSIKNDHEVEQQLLRLAEKKPREGQDKYYQRLRLEGFPWNYKRVRRVYCKLGLNHRKRAKKRVPMRIKEPLVQPVQLNQSWSLDFMTDAMANGRRFRTLNIIDDYNRKVIDIEADFSFPSTSVISVLKRAIHEHGKPFKIRTDNGPEFIAGDLTNWCEESGIEIQYIQPGKPTQNAYIERFNKTFRNDFLNAHLFEDIFQVRQMIEEWIIDYNYFRPHESLGNVPPILKEKDLTIKKKKVA